MENELEKAGEGKEKSLEKKTYLKDKYSEEFLINSVKELAKQFGRTPTGVEMAEKCKIPISIFINHFGSIGNAQKAAGCRPNVKGKDFYK